MDKKAQGLPISTIVIASVVLVVLVVLVGVFTGYFGKWRSQFLQAAERPCESEGIMVRNDACGENELELFGSFGDVGPGQKCCKLKSAEGSANVEAGRGTETPPPGTEEPPKHI